MLNRFTGCVAVICVALVPLGCGRVEEKSLCHFHPLRVERIQFSERSPAPFRALAERPIFDGAKAAQQEAVDEWIAGLVLFGQYSASTIDSALSLMLDKWSDTFEMARKKEEQTGVSRYLHHWYFDVRGRIAFVDENYLAYKVRLDEDEGWLHPFRNYRWSVWSFVHGRELSLYDIFEAESLPAVIALVKADMARRHGYSDFKEYSKERCIENFTELPVNFTLDEQGIEFLFNAYEIACHACGDIRGHVWWNQLNPYLRHDMKLYTKEEN